MLILISIDVQYLQNIVFSFEKGSDGQNYSLDSHHPIKNSLPSKMSEDVIRLERNVARMVDGELFLDGYMDMILWICNG